MNASIATLFDPPILAGAVARVAVPPHRRTLPLRVGTRTSPLALAQTRSFLDLLTRFCPVLRGMGVFREQAIQTTGDRVQDRSLAEIGGKGLFAKEIHEALLDRRIDLAVHSLKDLETTLPPGIALACVLRREDPRDALLLGEGCGEPDADDPWAALPAAAAIGTCSVRRQAQLLHARPDLRIVPMRGNVHSRLDKLRDGHCAATLLALAGLRRLDLAHLAAAAIAPERMLPASCQGIIGVTARSADTALCELLAAITDPPTQVAAEAERAMLAALDGSCRTPIGCHARPDSRGGVTVTGMVARADGGFLLRRSLAGAAADAAAIGTALGESLRRDSPCDLFG
ncbi:MAG TPA: hydroxymethylbilane synthase [Acetobacteraceae bacterium]|nr:hydroxymethylbilane synthase [Acetobacteraceae bacterium]